MCQIVYTKRVYLQIYTVFFPLYFIQLIFMDHAILQAASFTLHKLGTKYLHLATLFLKLDAKRRPDEFFNFEP